MSLLSRLSAPPAGHDLAVLAARLLSDPDSLAPVVLAKPGGSPALAEVGPLPPPPSAPAPAPMPRQRLVGPTGLGTSASRISVRGGGGSPGATAVPPLYCPPAIRDDPALGEEVNDRLVEWAGQVGIYPGRLDRVRAANFGRLLMLAHPETDEVDRLLAGAKCALAEWAVDDHYVDGEAEKAAPELLGQRLAIAYAAIDPAHLPERYTAQLEQALWEDPVMVALRSSLDNLCGYATPAQVARLRHELAVMFVAYNQEGVWRTTGRTPPVWEYLLHRHENSFLPCMSLIDVLAGYELPHAEFARPAVRRVFSLAGSASVLLNDLYSMTKEDPTDTNLPRVIAAEDGCPLPEAVSRSAELHDELMHTFEAEAAALCLTGSPELRQFLGGLWAWLGGSREWHRTTDRYQRPAHQHANA